MPYGDLTDASVAAERPLRARMIRTIRDNLAVSRCLTIPRTVGTFSTSSTSPDNFKSFRFWIPKPFVGLEGTRLHIAVSVGIPSSPSNTGKVRMGDGTSWTDYIEVESFGVTSKSEPFELDWTPTGDAVTTIHFQGETLNGSSSVTCSFDAGAGTTAYFLASMPR